MAKGSGTTRSAGSGATTATRSVQEYKDYYALQRGGALTALAEGKLTREEYDNRIVELAKRELKSTGEATIPIDVKKSIENRVVNTIKSMSGSNSAILIKNQMDKASEYYNDGVISVVQYNRIVKNGEKRIKELSKK